MCWWISVFIGINLELITGILRSTFHQLKKEKLELAFGNLAVFKRMLGLKSRAQSCCECGQRARMSTRPEMEEASQRKIGGLVDSAIRGQRVIAGKMLAYPVLRSSY